MNALKYIRFSGYLLVSMLLWACDVHEFPHDVPFVLHMDYDTELPLYKEITYENGTRASINENYDVRYTVNVYLQSEDEAAMHTPLYTFVFTKDDVNELNHSVELSIMPGNYNFIVWTDYIVSGGSDLHYDASRFEGIRLIGEEHSGSNDMRDAFKGSVSSKVSEKVREATVEMKRPMGKFNFIAPDMDRFILNVKSARIKKAEQNTTKTKEEMTKAIDISDFDVLFRYTGFMPDEYNMFTDKPSDSRTGVTFRSKLRLLENGEAELGFDYVLINNEESTVSVSVEIYDYDGELLSSFRPVDVPMIRSHLTTIRANFLTSGDGGVTVVPDFDDEYIYVVE